MCNLYIHVGYPRQAAQPPPGSDAAGTGGTACGTFFGGSPSLGCLRLRRRVSAGSDAAHTHPKRRGHPLTHTNGPLSPANAASRASTSPAAPHARCFESNSAACDPSTVPRTRSAPARACTCGRREAAGLEPSSRSAQRVCVCVGVCVCVCVCVCLCRLWPAQREHIRGVRVSGCGMRSLG